MQLPMMIKSCGSTATARSTGWRARELMARNGMRNTRELVGPLRERGHPCPSRRSTAWSARIPKGSPSSSWLPSAISSASKRTSCSHSRPPTPGPNARSRPPPPGRTSSGSLTPTNPSGRESVTTTKPGTRGRRRSEGDHRCRPMRADGREDPRDLARRAQLRDLLHQRTEHTRILLRLR
jgi:hypothetical protein